MRRLSLVMLMMATSVLMQAKAFSANFEASAANNKVTLDTKVWFSGVADCSQNVAPPIEVFEQDESTFVLRQNKCTHYEAPFMYLLLGEHSSILIDTGASQEQSEFPIAQTIAALVKKHLDQKESSAKAHKLWVAHSHSHGDHIAGDQQFTELSIPDLQVMVVPANNLQAVKTTFTINQWPSQLVQLDLGGRLLDIIPSPGHQSEAITFYDHQTKWLLTGDTFYPGRLYIREWKTFKDTIKRLVTFTRNNPVSAILGAHIEMSAVPSVEYEVGSTYQPNEMPLALTTKDLEELNSLLTELGDTPKKVTRDKFVVYPVK